MTLTGKVAIVTGGNSGIGKAIVLALAEAGANIVIDYVADEQATEDLERQIVALGDQAIGVEADVSKVADLERLIKPLSTPSDGSTSWSTTPVSRPERRSSTPPKRSTRR